MQSLAVGISQEKWLGSCGLLSVVALSHNKEFMLQIALLLWLFCLLVLALALYTVRLIRAPVAR